MSEQRTKHLINKWLIVLLFAAASILSAISAKDVKINYNLADYLNGDTQTKIALDIINDEFGATGTMQVLAKNVSADTAEDICEKIEGIENVLNVNFDKYDEAYYKDNNALFIVLIDGDDYSDNAKQVSADIKEALSSYDEIEYGGTAIEKQSLQESITSEMDYILTISLCLVAVILLITSESWLEPIVLLAASGVAVLINRGTNIFLGEISYITNSIAAVLQLALSMDYSIVLLHAYRREKEKNTDNNAAMLSAIKSVVKPVSASALTTIAGLLALLFMSFRIGFDIGIVLMKGIVISAITSVTLLPSIVVLLDGPMKKLRKKAFVPKGEVFCKISFKASKAIVPIALVIVIVCGYLQSGNSYIFTDTKAGNTAIADIFGNNNSVAVVYKNSDDSLGNEKKLIDSVEAYKTAGGENVLASYTAYTNTVKEDYDVEKAVRKLELSEDETELLFTMYNLYASPSDVKMSFAEFIDFAYELMNTDEDAKEFIDEDTSDTLEAINMISEVTSEELTADELYEKLTSCSAVDMKIDSFLIEQIYKMYFYENGAMPAGKMNGRTFAEYVLSLDESNSVVHEQLTDDNRDKLADMLTVSRYRADSAKLTYKGAYNKFSELKSEIKSDAAGSILDEDKIAGVYIKYSVNNGKELTTPVTACDLLDFVSDNMDSNVLLKQKMTDENREKVADAQDDIKKADDLFLGEDYSRLLLSVNLPNESEDSSEFVEYLSDEVKRIFGDEAYITGEIVTVCDLEDAFGHDNAFITVFTLVSIFVIIMIIFRSLSLPVILVAIIQGAIFIAMSTQLLGDGIFFMSYIVTTCILMGATIDYGILMSSNYVADRIVCGKEKSLEMSVETAMPTIFTSGLILAVCGFVIHFISSQNSISTVGLLLGIGSICSTVMVTVVLPSVLYLTDAFVLKATQHKTGAASDG
jgi:uncharacterized protein